jgi:hypothetical protein
MFFCGLIIIYIILQEMSKKKGLNCSSQKWQNPKCGKFYTIGCVMSICHQALITPGNGLSTSRVHTCCSLLYGVKFSS